MTQPDPLRTIEEAAERCRVPVATVRYWRATNRGPKFFRMGRRLVCKESELQAHLGTEKGDLWVVPADLIHTLIDALVDGDDDALAELVDINKKKEN